jgi:hypothetical protein
LASAARSEPQIVRGHFSLIANEQAALGDRGNVPSLAVKSFETCQLLVPLGRRLEQDHLAAFRKNDEMAVGKEDLSETVAPALPLALPRTSVNASKDRIV